MKELDMHISYLVRGEWMNTESRVGIIAETPAASRPQAVAVSSRRRRRRAQGFARR